MIELGYRLSFNTPAFLGNAEQSAQWRTPPIKALLRQWWRVAYAADHRNTLDVVGAMRRAEGQLFGVAANKDGDSRQSRVRLRLSSWDLGTLKSWNGHEQKPVDHEEVQQTRGKVGPHAYLGFGPLDGRGGTKLSEKAKSAIDAGRHAELRLAVRSDVDDAEASRLRTALHLMHLYGALGGRSRNGWGSFALEPLDASSVLVTSLDAHLTLPWRDALKQDWPQAIGTDDKGVLIWQTDASEDWKSVMRRLAEIKIGLRTQQAFKFPQEKPDGQVHDRHWLSYPVTRHDVFTWKKEGLRLPNSLRFKVRMRTDGKLHGVIFHVPCLPPPSFRPDPSAIENVWGQVHGFLDRHAHLTRIPA